MLKIVEVKKYAQSPTFSSSVKKSKNSKLKLSQKIFFTSAVVKTLKCVYNFTGPETKQQGGAASELRRPRPASILLNEDDSRGRRI